MEIILIFVGILGTLFFGYQTFVYMKNKMRFKKEFKGILTPFLQELFDDMEKENPNSWNEWEERFLKWDRKSFYLEGETEEEDDRNYEYPDEKTKLRQLKDCVKYRRKLVKSILRDRKEREKSLKNDSKLKYK